MVSKHSTDEFVCRKYEFVKQLGIGSFGKVDLIRDRNTGEKRVCKKVSTIGMPPPIVAMTQKEVELLAELDHPHIVRLFEYADSNNLFTLVMEYIPGGDGLKLLQRVGRGLEEPYVANLINQVLVALSYCHARGVVHRDVKPENFMITESGAWGEPMLKVIDFGLAVKGSSNEFLGTGPYMAPEIVAQKGAITYRSDIWSVGVCTIELLTKTAPFGKLHDNGGSYDILFDRIKSFRRLEDIDKQMSRYSTGDQWSGRSPMADAFLRKLLQPDPKQRPQAGRAERDPWMTAHKSAPAGLTGEMLRSLAAYASAPPTVCCCLFAIAVRADVPDIEKLGKAFVSMDTNGNGKITRAEISAAVNRSRWWWDPEVDVWSLVKTADLDHTGGLNYTEFVAACLYANHSSLEELVRASFTALDSNRDGLVRLSDIRDLFRERDFAVLNQLPQDRPFNLAEWQRTLLNSFPAPARNILPGTEPSVQEVLGGLAMCKKPPRYHSDDDMNFQISGMNRPRQGRGRGASPNHLMDSDEIPQCEILMESVDHPQCGSWQRDLLETLGIRRWFPES